MVLLLMMVKSMWGGRMEGTETVRYHTIDNLPGGTVGYPAHPRLIRPSVSPSVCHITFNYSAENRPGPTDLVKYSLKNVN